MCLSPLYKKTLKINFYCIFIFQLRELRTVDSLYIITKEFVNFEFKDDKEAALKQLQDLVPQFEWETGLEVWQKYFSFDQPITLKPQSKKIFLIKHTTHLKCFIVIRYIVVIFATSCV